MVINLQASGAAGFGIAQGPFTVPVRSNGVSHFTEDTTNDVLDEPDATVTYTVLPGTGYTVGTASSTTVTIQDDDTLPGAPSISSVTASAGQLTAAWSAPSDPGDSDGTDNDVTAYDVRYILTSAADKSDGQWTVEYDAWTSGNLEYTFGGPDHRPVLRRAGARGDAGRNRSLVGHEHGHAAGGAGAERDEARRRWTART